MQRTQVRALRAPEFAPDSIEAHSVHAALSAKNMLWTAEFQPMFLAGERRIDGHRALVRSDNGAVLGVHGMSYAPVQQLEAFAGVQTLLDAGSARILRAGQFDGGAKVFVEVEVGEARAAVKVGDPVRLKALFKNSHDGSSNLTAAYLLERLVCLNGMTRATTSNLFKGRHTRGIYASLDRWQLEFSEQREALEKQVDVYRMFATRRLGDKNLVRYIRETLSEGAGNDNSIVVRGVERIVELAHTAPGASPGTLWGGLNAITYWATHERGRTAEGRESSLLFGNGGALIARATEVAEQYAPKLPVAA